MEWQRLKNKTNQMKDLKRRKKIQLFEWTKDNIHNNGKRRKKHRLYVQNNAQRNKPIEYASYVYK